MESELNSLPARRAAARQSWHWRAGWKKGSAGGGEGGRAISAGYAENPTPSPAKGSLLEGEAKGCPLVMPPLRIIQYATASDIAICLPLLGLQPLVDCSLLALQARNPLILSTTLRGKRRIPLWHKLCFLAEQIFEPRTSYPPTKASSHYTPLPFLSPSIAATPRTANPYWGNLGAASHLCRFMRDAKYFAWGWHKPPDPCTACLPFPCFVSSHR